MRNRRIPRRKCANKQTVCLRAGSGAATKIQGYQIANYCRFKLSCSVDGETCIFGSCSSPPNLSSETWSRCCSGGGSTVGLYFPFQKQDATETALKVEKMRQRDFANSCNWNHVKYEGCRMRLSVCFMRDIVTGIWQGLYRLQVAFGTRSL